METRITVDEERLIADFMTLVSIASHSREEAHVASYIRGAVEELGFAVTEDNAATEVGGTSGNLIVRVPGDESKPAILLMAHMDTAVPGQGVRPMRKGDRITSDGKTVLGADDKAGIAGLLHLMRALASGAVGSHPPLDIVFTVCEEIGLLGAKALKRELLRASYGFVFDSGGDIGLVVVGSPAQAKLRAVVRGRAAHAGISPEKGISAIEIAADAISAMPLGRVDDVTTANIGMIKGGFSSNIVCDAVELIGEVRSSDETRMQEQQSAMVEALERAAQRRGGGAECEWLDSYPVLSVPRDSFVLGVVGAALEDIGMRAVFGATGGGSDANVLAGMGIPVVNVAIGYQQIHTLEEFILLKDLRKAAELMIAIVRRCNGDM